MDNPGGQLGTSIDSLTNQYGVIAHNLANINTSGFKRTVNSFSKALMNQLDQGADGAVGSGEIEFNSAIDFSQGSLLRTERSLDVAVDGKGFFVVETPDGPLYTRNGMFQVNQQGQLVDHEGRMVSGDGGPIVIPPGVGVGDISIGDDGSIGSPGGPLGKLQLVDFKEDEGKLIPVGKNCYAAPGDVSPAAAENAMIRQGYKESSNVSRMEEVVDLMTVSRLYELNMKLLVRRQEMAKTIIGVANG
ncbi:MAG: flagellar hook-basal body protein [Planctomycetota bacterium]